MSRVDGLPRLGGTLDRRDTDTLVMMLLLVVVVVHQIIVRPHVEYQKLVPETTLRTLYAIVLLGALFTFAYTLKHASMIIAFSYTFFYLLVMVWIAPLEAVQQVEYFTLGWIVVTALYLVGSMWLDCIPFVSSLSIDQLVQYSTIINAGFGIVKHAAKHGLDVVDNQVVHQRLAYRPGAFVSGSAAAPMLPLSSSSSSSPVDHPHQQ